MSTRCNVIVKDSFGDQIMFYRHCDGYPEGVAKTLGEFIQLVRDNKLRDNAEQAAGWLIVLGYEEYLSSNSLQAMRTNTQGTSVDGWKVGAYEPCLQLHTDIEYLYEIDLVSKTIRAWEMHYSDKKGKEVTKALEREIKKLAKKPPRKRKAA